MAIATLSIDLEARLAKFEQGLDRAARLAEKNAEQQRAAWARVGATVAGVAGTIAGAFAGVSAMGWLREQADALDALNDAADATGASIENLSALESIGKSVGTQFDTITGILVKFNAVLADAKPGSAQAEALKAIGLQAAELQRLDPAEALRRTAVALAGYADDGNKARLVQDLFGKSVREAAPFLKDLAEAGEVNGKTTAAQAAEAEKFNKQLYAFQKNASESGRAIINDLLPAINNMFDRVKKDGGFFAAFLADLKIGFNATSAKNATDQVDRLLKDLERLEAVPEGTRNPFQKAQIKDLREEISALQKEAFRANEQVKQLLGTGAGESSGAEQGEAKKTVGVYDKDSGKVPKARKPELMGPDLPDSYKRAQALIEQTDDFKRQQLVETLEVLLRWRDQLGSSDALEAAIAKTREELEKLSPAARKAAEEQRALQKLLDGMQSAQLEKARADMVRLAQAFEAGTITAEQFNDAATQRLGGNAAPEIEKTVEAIDEMVKQAARNIQDALGDTLLQTLDGKFDGILDLWANLLKRMAAEALGAQLGKYLLGDFGKTGELGGVVGKGLTALFDWLLPDSFMPASPFWAKGGAFDAAGPIKPFATGDVFDRATLFGYGGGRLGVLGEAGPEAIMPLRRGADGKLGVASAGGGGGTRVTVPITIQAGVTRAEVAQLIPVIQEQAKAAVFQAMRRPGSAFRN